MTQRWQSKFFLFGIALTFVLGIAQPAFAPPFGARPVPHIFESRPFEPHRPGPLLPDFVDPYRPGRLPDFVDPPWTLRGYGLPTSPSKPPSEWTSWKDLPNYIPADGIPL